MDIKRVPVILFVFLWLGGTSRAAPGCACSAEGAPCAVFWQTTTVFAGRVESISSPAAGANGSLSPDREVRFRVLERFRGAAGGEVSVVAAGGVCRFRFSQGRDYLVYASRNDETGRLTVSACSRTQLLEAAAADLSYARAASGVLAIAPQVTGTIAFDGRRGAIPSSMDGASIVLAKDGAETRTAIDSHGRFVIEGLTPGAYQVRLEAPAAFYGEVWPNPIGVPVRGCAELSGVARFNGRLRGRVVDRSGVPIAGLTVEVAPVRGRTGTTIDSAHTVTGSDGAYELTRLQAGEYVLGINTSVDAERAQLPSAFYPGVVRLAGARRIRLSAGQSVALDDFVLPPGATAVRLSGVVFDPDGRPAAGARVFLKGAAGIDYVVADPVTTDGQGRFVVAAFAGSHYRLFAERDRNRSRLDSSDEIPITADSDLLPVKVLLRLRTENLPALQNYENLRHGDRKKPRIKLCPRLSSLNMRHAHTARSIQRVPPCGCLVGVYETYDAEVVNILDARSSSCERPEHQTGKPVPIASRSELADTPQETVGFRSTSSGRSSARDRRD